MTFDTAQPESNSVILQIGEGEPASLHVSNIDPSGKANNITNRTCVNTNAINSVKVCLFVMIIVHGLKITNFFIYDHFLAFEIFGATVGISTLTKRRQTIFTTQRTVPLTRARVET